MQLIEAGSSWWEERTTPPGEKLQLVIPESRAQGVGVPSTHFTGSSAISAEANAVKLAESAGLF